MSTRDWKGLALRALLAARADGTAVEVALAQAMAAGRDAGAPRSQERRLRQLLTAEWEERDRDPAVAADDGRAT